VGLDYWKVGRAPAGSSTIADLLTITSSGDVAAAAGNLSVSTVGKGLAVKEGSNAKQGAVTLVAGTVTVANTSVTASSRIFLTSNSGGSGTPGWVRESARVAGVSFTLTSSSVTDGSIVVYEIFEPA